MGRFLRPTKLSIALFILFLVFLVTPLAASRYFDFSTGFFNESQKYSDVFNRGVGHVFMLWDHVAFLSIFGLWFLSGYWFVADSFGMGAGSFAQFRGTIADVLGVILILISVFLYYLLACRIASLIKSDLTKNWMMGGIGILVIILPLSFYSYAKGIAGEIKYLATVENCTIRCVFPTQQQLTPSITVCHTQCNAKQWPSDEQRISCWNHCGDALEAARAECQNTCKSSLK
jgi:hypothetical protein